MSDAAGELERLLREGRDAEALTLLLRLTEAAANPELLLNLATVQRRLGELGAALATAERARAQRPAWAEVHMNLGTTFERMPELASAAAAYRAALACDASHARAHNSLGAVLMRQGQVPDALPHYQRAAELAPGWAAPHHHIAAWYEAQNQPALAIPHYEQALKRDPGFVPSHTDLGTCLLETGDLERGWREYTWRFGRPTIRPHPELGLPIWQGEPLEGRTIVGVEEQGFGDTLMFVRFGRQVAERGGRFTVLCRTPSHALLRRSPWISSVVGRPAEVVADLQVPMASLPQVLGVHDVESVRAPSPYLVAPPAPELDLPKTLNVGVVWKTSPLLAHRKSCPPEVLAGLAEVPGVTLFALEFGEPPPIALQGALRPDLQPRVGDFAETAALVKRGARALAT